MQYRSDENTFVHLTSGNDRIDTSICLQQVQNIDDLDMDIDCLTMKADSNLKLSTTKILTTRAVFSVCCQSYFSFYSFILVGVGV